jgi:hypothetical protein
MLSSMLFRVCHCVTLPQAHTGARAHTHAHVFTHSLTHSFTHALSHPLTHSLTHSLTDTHTHTHQQNAGVHTFVVQLRSLEDHSVLPGIRLGDCGAKMGRNGLDNGWIQFDHVRGVGVHIGAAPDADADAD